MIELKTNKARLVVEAPRGGNIKSWSIDQKEIFYTDEKSWAGKTIKYKGGNPIMFPIFSTLCRDGGGELYYDGNKIELAQHGLARISPAWKALQETEDSLLLILHANEESLKYFPYQFEFKVHMKLLDNALHLKQEVFNAGDSTMPFCTGFHPYFAVSDPIHCELNGIPWGTPMHIQPNHDEHQYDTHYQNSLAFGKEEINHHFRILKDKVTLTDRLSGRRIQIIRDGNYPCITAWSEVGNPFVCIEPNTARRGAFENRQDLIRIAPGETWTGKVKYVVEQV